MKATTGVGDPWYTSGVHEWNGTGAILNPKPTSSNPKPARSNGGVPAVSRLGTTSPGAGPTEGVKPTMCARFVEPVEPYTRAMPYRKNADENAPRMKYFMPASCDSVRRRCI